MIACRHQMQNTLLEVDRMVASVKAVVCMVLDSEAVFRCEVCTSEVLTNIVKHAASNAPIDLIINESADAILIEVVDPLGAEAFDPRAHATDIELLDPHAESGRGLGLIMRCADSVRYGPKGDRNHLTLTFKKVNDDAQTSDAPFTNHSGENHEEA